MKLPTIKLSRRTGTIVVLTVVVILGLGGTSAYAAESNALPGSALYPFKKGWEEVRLLLAFSPAAKAKTNVDIAHNRIKAAQNVASQTPAATTVVVPALQEAQQQLSNALNQTNNITDPSQRREVKRSISKEASDAETELEHSNESESSDDKQNTKSTSEQLQQIQDQSSTDD